MRCVYRPYNICLSIMVLKLNPFVYILHSQQIQFCASMDIAIGLVHNKIALMKTKQHGKKLLTSN